MHIVYISREYPPSFRMGGIAAYLKEVAESYAKQGHRVTVISASDDTRREYEEKINGVRVFRLKGGDFINTALEPSFCGLKKFRSIYRFYSYRHRIRTVLKTLHNVDTVDVVEVGEFGAESYYLYRLGLPISIRLHTPTLLDRSTNGIRKWSFRFAIEYWIGKKELSIIHKATAITSCSKSLLDWMLKYSGKNIPSAKIIYNPVNLKTWKRRASNSYGENTVLFAGTVAEAKGVGNLVDACAELRRNGIPITLTIAGKLGRYGCLLKNKCEDEGYTWCKFTGHISREELKNLYTCHKIACFPSWWENMPMVCLEAMAIGNVVIGSSNGGMSEIITDGEDGFLVKPKDSSLLANVIKRALMLEYEEVNVLRQKAYSTITKKFSTDNVLNQLESHYKSICNIQ